MRFYLGTHQTGWLSSVDVPLFVSHRRLRERKRLPVAREGWALDSGGFTELSKPPHRWQTTVSEYVEAVARYSAEIGRLEWAAPMDHMCEPFIVDATGLSVLEHQHRTVENFLELRDQGPFVPVLQGWSLADYEACVGLYATAGVDLTAYERVGVGSVCRRQDTAEIGRIFAMIHDAGIRAHGFGVKKQGVAGYGHLLASADSMAWSYAARRAPPMPGCSHPSCQNCSRFALRWRGQVMTAIERARARPSHIQMAFV